MKIRKATNKDATDIKRLIKLYPDKLLQNHLPKMSEFFVAIDDQPSPDGFGMARQIVGCAAFVVYSKRLAEIRSVSVEKDFQGKGIASKLVEECLKLAKKKKIHEVITITGANGLFEKFGFGAFCKEKYALLKFMK